MPEALGLFILRLVEFSPSHFSVILFDKGWLEKNLIVNVQKHFLMLFSFGEFLLTRFFINKPLVAKVVKLRSSRRQAETNKRTNRQYALTELLQNHRHSLAVLWIRLFFIYLQKRSASRICMIHIWERKNITKYVSAFC